MGTIRIKIIAWFITGFVLAGAGFYFVYSSFDSMGRSLEVLGDPDMSYRLVNDIQTDLVKTENSMRSYMMSGSLEFLDDYLEGMDRIGLNLTRLSQMQGSAIQQKTLDNLESLLANRADLMYDLVDLKHEKNNSTLANKTLLQIQEELSSQNNQNATSPDDTSDTADDLALLKSPTVADNNGEEEKNKLKGLFRRKKSDNKQIAPIYNVKLDSDSSSSGNGTSNYIISYETDINVDQVRQILRDINKEEQQFNARLNKRELEILASDRLIMSTVNDIMTGLEKNSDVLHAELTAAAQETARNTGRNIFLIAVAALLTGVLLLIALMNDLKRSARYRRDLEEAKEYAEHLALSRQRFLASMSHEIRTPLNAIIGFAEQSAHTADPETAAHIGRITTASDHLLEIVNDILDYSKLELGKVQLQCLPFTVTQILEELKSLMNQRAREQGIGFHITSDHGCTSPVEGDPLRLKQVLINLIGNAIKFTHEGQVEVSATSSIKNKYIDFIFRIADTGIGIPEDKLEYIFEDFKQLDNDTSRQYGGSGLGLAITKKIIEQHQGQISVTSTSGEGSVFTVELRYKVTDKEVAAMSDASANTPIRLKGMRILVADDEPFNLQLARLILEKSGAEVVTCQHPDDIDAILDEKLFDCYIIDLHMPGKDGWEVAQSIRIKDSLAYIIASTADVITPVATLLEKEHTFDAVLHKPYKEQALLQMVRRAAEDIDLSQDWMPEEDTSFPDTNYTDEQLYALDEIKIFAAGDIETEQEIIMTFVATSTDMMQELELAKQQKSLEVLNNIAHKLLPSYQHFHIHTLTGHLKYLEKAADWEEDKINAAVDAVITTTRQVHTALKEELKTLQA
jgi:signal transduction histidine kinase/CheY-like chemotaxis protein